MMETQPRTKVIVIEGPFDDAATQRLARALAQVDANARVVIDLTHVTEFPDYSVMAIAQALAARGPRMAVRGLRQHHLRLLRYLGVHAAEELAGA